MNWCSASSSAHGFLMRGDLHSVLEWVEPSHLKDMDPAWYTSKREGARINEHAQYAGTSMKIKGNSQEMKSQNMRPLNSNTCLIILKHNRRYQSRHSFKTYLSNLWIFPTCSWYKGCRNECEIVLFFESLTDYWDDTCQLT